MSYFNLYDDVKLGLYIEPKFYLDGNSEFIAPLRNVILFLFNSGLFLSPVGTKGRLIQTTNFHFRGISISYTLETFPELGGDGCLEN